MKHKRLWYSCWHCCPDSTLLYLGFAANGDVASGAVEETWKKQQSRSSVVEQSWKFPALDMILAIAFFVKLGGAYF